LKRESIYLVDKELESLNESVIRRFQRSLVSRLQDSITPNAVFSVVGVPKKLKQRRLLAISSWYLGDFGPLVRLELERDRDLLVKLACTSKTAAIEILISNYSERDFFGNVIPTIKSVNRRLNYILRSPKRPKETIRRRGYRDHGSQKPESKKHRNEPDYELIQLQLLIDERRKLLSDTVEFLRGFVE
jgi:hypothetical protein